MPSPLTPSLGAEPGFGEEPYVPQLTPAQEKIKTGRELLDAKKNAEALKYFQEAAELDPQEPVAHYFLGVAYRMLNRYDDAIVAFSDAIRLDPADGEAHLRRGIVWFYKGEYGVAWDDFEEASGSEMLFDDPWPELWKGLAKAKQKKWREAINAFGASLRHDPHFAPSYVNRGLAYLAVNEPEKAIADFDQAIRHQPLNPGNYFKRATSQAQVNRLQDAVDSYNEAVRLDPEYAEAYYNRSLLHRQLGNTDESNKDRTRALRLNPHIEQQVTSAG
jgi:tetratricopeptide (TPR) repeat protein